MSIAADVPGRAETVFVEMRQGLGAAEVGQPVEVRGLNGQLERIGALPGPNSLLLRLTDPVPGFLALHTWQLNDATTRAQIEGYLFSPDASEYVAREQPAWKAWLQNLAVPAV
jgi:hypothetical protein